MVVPPLIGTDAAILEVPGQRAPGPF